MKPLENITQILTKLEGAYAESQRIKRIKY